MDLFHGGEVDARVGAEQGGGLFLAVVHPKDLRPFAARDCRAGARRAGAAGFRFGRRLRQPWRKEVPTQSVPVSPPPRTTTSLPAAEMQAAGVAGVEEATRVRGQEFHGEMDALEIRGPRRAGRGAGWRRCRGRRRRARSARRSAGRSSPTSVRVTNPTPSVSSCSTRRCTRRLSSFMFGMPYMSRPPTRSARSKTVDAVAGLVELGGGAQAGGAGADDGDASCRCGSRAVRRVIQPFSQPWSTMLHSISLMVTGVGRRGRRCRSLRRAPGRRVR